MKKALFYTLVRRWSDSGFVVMAVTTEKSRQYFGRTLPAEEPTHVRISDTSGKFADMFQAQAKIAEVQAIREKYKPLIKIAYEGLHKLQNAEIAEIKRVTGEDKYIDP